MSKKIDNIKNLNISDMSSLISNLLEKMGFVDIVRNEDCISCAQNMLLGKSITVFITFPFKMGGIVSGDYKQYAKKITTIRDKYSANEVCVYSTNTISNGFKDSLDSNLGALKIKYIGRDDLISLIDNYFPEYWRHDDIALVKYEKDVLYRIGEDSELRRLKFPQEKYTKLLNIFIEPFLTRYYEDSKTKAATQKKYSVDELIAHKESSVIEGQAGSGKSTLLKHIVRKEIEANRTKNKKYYPIYLSALDIFKANFKIGDAIRNQLGDYTEAPLSELCEAYEIQIFIDSIDEFDEEQTKILEELVSIENKYKIKYYIASRNADALMRKTNSKLSNFSIRRFNIEQVKRFLTSFFSGDDIKAFSLLDAIRSNQMLEKMPITPLTLSLISILFEENEFEVPATVSDIFDNFNTLIIGKAVVSSKIEFIDASFKERIISIYAFKLLNTQSHIPMKKDEFISFFKDYYEGKSLPIKKGTLEDVLTYLIGNTGILYLKDGCWVAFTHDAYMEYYAALEIFKHLRLHERDLVSNFFDPNWQSAAIFYGGMSKDMPDFLRAIKEKISKSRHINEYMASIFGAGYLLQALYQTDNTLRKEVILEALNLSLKNLQIFKMIAADNLPVFKNYKLPILHLINFVYFYESFNSITLGQPLAMAFEEKYKEFAVTNDYGDGYGLFELAFTMDSRRINNTEPLTKLIMDTPEVLKDPSLHVLAEFSMVLLGKDKYKEFIQELKKSSAKLSDVQYELATVPMSKMRFSALDTIQKKSKVTLFVEGKTDAVIIEHAFMVLTNGELPYWNIQCAGSSRDRGSCEQVAQTLNQSYAHWKNSQDNIYIGIFDHDNAGIGSYNGRLEKVFEEKERLRLKKHAEANIYGLCIPVPGEMDQYLQEKQEFNFFEIEHYFGHEYLKKHDMLKPTSLPDIFEIKDTTGVKTNFANNLRNEVKPCVFQHFALLFKIIDDIVGVHINYEI